LLGKGELRAEAAVAFRLLYRVEVGSLEILDEGKRKKCFVVVVLDDGRNLRPSKASRSTESAFTGDQLEVVPGPPYGDRLE